MKLTVEPNELLTESSFNDFIKAAAFGAGLALAPTTNATELETAEFPKELIVKYNVLKKEPTFGVAEAQRMADEAITYIGNEAEDGTAEQTPSWKSAQNAYVYLLNRDYKLATAFLSKFNHDAKTLFGSQIKALPKPVRRESMELPISEHYLSLHEGGGNFDKWKASVFESMNDGMFDLSTMSDKDLAECNKLLEYYHDTKKLDSKIAARWISVDLKRFMQSGKSRFS